MACAPSEDSDQPGHLPSLIRVFAVRMKKHRVLSYPWSALRRLWSDQADAQADLSLRWAHRPFCWFFREAALFRYCILFGLYMYITSVYRKFPKYSDTQNICSNDSKIWTMWLYHRVMSPNDADRMANSVDPDQTAPRSSLIWVCTVCPGISIRKLRIITVTLFCLDSRIVFLPDSVPYTLWTSHGI